MSPISEHRGMRMTLNNLAKLLRRQLRRSGASLVTTMIRFLRLGLTPYGKPVAKPFVVHPRPLGLPPHLSYDHVEGLIEAQENPLHR